MRHLILDRFKSLRQFSQQAQIPYSTLMTILSRDLGGASFDVVLKICRALELDPYEFEK